MAVSIKFTKFDNTPWGFRLAGGSDFPQPLTVIRVTEGSLAECMGLKVGDVVVRLNDQPISNLTHGQAHEELMRAGNNFVLGVKREEDPLKALEALSEENIVPYKIPLADLPPVYPEQILQEETTVIERHEETTCDVKSAEEEVKPEVEPLPDKPKDANSEIVPNQNLTDDEIAQLILEEEELLSDKGLLGVNFKKLRPRVTVLKQSKVVEELQNIATAEPPLVEQLRRTSVFLQKPQRPVPEPRKKQEEQQQETEVESYRVVIKKQKKRSVTDRLLAKGLLKPEGASTPEPLTPEATPSATPEPGGCRSDQEREPESRPESKAESKQGESETEQQQPEGTTPCKEESHGEETDSQEQTAQESILNEIEKEMANVAAAVDKEKIKELVSTEMNLEKQLENVQRQLLALKQLPSEIESHLRIVSEQLQKIMELSGVQNGATGNDERQQEAEVEAEEAEETEETETQELEETEEQDVTEYTEDISYSAYSEEHRIVQASEEEDEEETETQELEGTLSVKSEEGSRVKKFVVSYETKVLKSPSPAPSHGSFEPDPNLSAKDQVIQELQQRVKQRAERKRSQDLWPQAKQVELTLGRRWRCPNDFFNDEMIAEVLSSQAEVIRGRALGVNFKKYEKTNLPNYDHLMNSSVYKMIHKMDREPTRGIPARPAKVNAAEDIIERAKSPALSIPDDRSTRSVSH
ncbi:altered inheritance of mitochondria protein 21-like isoform X2 [Frieseomelitta varia]|uniref:altered inheritance of mitochondria protein 21-like isoform X2 n=1 Tax=Frieseomelitta varia TaxID=561572 RepID=UPI001CB68807|nr:altered inheritance of mitochondria protein 21-like isoform X2 [Frieseomelitta varia]